MSKLGDSLEKLKNIDFEAFRPQLENVYKKTQKQCRQTALISVDASPKYSVEIKGDLLFLALILKKEAKQQNTAIENKFIEDPL